MCWRILKVSLLMICNFIVIKKFEYQVKKFNKCKRGLCRSSRSLLFFIKKNTYSRYFWKTVEKEKWSSITPTRAHVIKMLSERRNFCLKTHFSSLKSIGSWCEEIATLFGAHGASRNAINCICGRTSSFYSRSFLGVPLICHINDYHKTSVTFYFFKRMKRSHYSLFYAGRVSEHEIRVGGKSL